MNVCVGEGWIGKGEDLQNMVGESKLDEGDTRDLGWGADRKQGAWRGLSLGMPQRLGLCRRELRKGSWRHQY